MKCSICPRNCGAERAETGNGICGMGESPVLARAGIHKWEEPCISGERGSGTVFFSGCSLKCVFCQNYKISTGGFGKAVPISRLREIYFELIDQGVHNINLVNPTHFAHAVIESLQRPLPVPVVWNSGGYDKVETLRALKGKVQIYLPDMKYISPALSEKYSGAPDYAEVAKKAIMEMYEQTGPYEMDEYGMLQKGVMIRHLVLPGQIENTMDVIDWVAKTFEPGQVLFCLMSQFTPTENCKSYPEIARPLTRIEHEMAVDYLSTSGIEDGFYQDLESSSDSFIPDFDLTGI